MIPGIIAFHLYGDALPSMDAAYPTLARDVLPTALHGVFLAVVIGLVASSFNSLVNSAATLISVDLLPQRIADRSVSSARVQSMLIVGLSFIIAMQLPDATEGLWQLIRRFTGFYNIPIIALVLVALLNCPIDPRAGLTVIGLHVLIYGLCTFVIDTGIHFVHLYAILFVLETGLMLLWPRPVCASLPPLPMKSPVDLTPWRGRIPATWLLIACIMGLYVLFSLLGISA